MFILKKIVEAFVLPPGFMVPVLAVLGIYLWRRARRAALACAALSALIWIGTSGRFCDQLLRPLEDAYSVPAKPEGDVIILLCGGFRGTRKPYSASERLAPGTLERAAAAYKLHRGTGLPLLVSGGAPFSDEPEAEAAAAFLRELGVPAGKIFTETRSRDTLENAAYSAAICREKGFRKPLLLTSAYHMPRAVLLFSKAGTGEIAPFPVARRSDGPHYFTDYLPGGGLEARLAANEYLGLAYYRLYFAFF
jgi:uncharacterized SAM-binding protein YcdF (DUF218 family)